MKRALFILTLVMPVLFSACFEVSEENLFESFEEQVVIEALVNNIDTQYIVKVSHTVHPDSQFYTSPIADAQVILSGNLGESEALTMVEPGIYRSNNIKGKPNSEYSLRVYADNENYIAIETMVEPGYVHKVDLVYLDKHVENIGYYIRLYIEKDKSKTKYYKLDVVHNDSIYSGYTDLLLTNDAYSQEVLEYLVPYAFQKNDSVKIYLHSISESMSKYYYELSKQTNNAFSYIQSPMSNPPSNFSNNALGYFQVSAITPINIVITD